MVFAVNVILRESLASSTFSNRCSWAADYSKDFSLNKPWMKKHNFSNKLYRELNNIYKMDE